MLHHKDWNNIASIFVTAGIESVEGSPSVGDLLTPDSQGTSLLASTIKHEEQKLHDREGEFFSIQNVLTDIVPFFQMRD